MSEKKFWNRIKNNRFCRGMLWLLGAILLIIMAIYLAVPSYSFADIELKILIIRVLKCMNTAMP